MNVRQKSAIAALCVLCDLAICRIMLIHCLVIFGLYPFSDCILCCTIFGYIPNSLPEVQFLVPDCGMKPAMVSGRAKISCTGTTCLTNLPRKVPFSLYSLSPHSAQFQQSAGGRGHPSLVSLWLQVCFMCYQRNQSPPPPPPVC